MMDEHGGDRAGEMSGLGITWEIVESDEEHVVCRMPFTDDLKSATGVVHAGAMLWLADLTATFLGQEVSEVAEDGRGFPLLIDLHASVLANQQGGDVFAEARIVRRGRRVTVIRTKVTGTDDKLLAEVTTTHIPW
ncbi:MAG: PaaI family thioesterase [Dehalococcoidia bacterium]